jgi:hypothetical protein
MFRKKENPTGLVKQYSGVKRRRKAAKNLQMDIFV